VFDIAATQRSLAMSSRPSYSDVFATLTLETDEDAARKAILQAFCEVTGLNLSWDEVNTPTPSDEHSMESIDVAVEWGLPALLPSDYEVPEEEAVRWHLGIYRKNILMERDDYPSAEDIRKQQAKITRTIESIASLFGIETAVSESRDQLVRLLGRKGKYFRRNRILRDFTNAEVLRNYDQLEEILFTGASAIYEGDVIGRTLLQAAVWLYEIDESMSQATEQMVGDGTGGAPKKLIRRDLVRRLLTVKKGPYKSPVLGERLFKDNTDAHVEFPCIAGPHMQGLVSIPRSERESMLPPLEVQRKRETTPAERIPVGLTRLRREGTQRYFLGRRVFRR